MSSSSTPHTGFARTLVSENRQTGGGLVHQTTFDRLLCTGCTIDVSGEKFNARVVVTHSFVNHFPCVTPACLGFRVDPSWQVTLLRIDTIDGKFMLSQQNLVSESEDKNKGGKPVSLTSNEHVTATSDVISCDLPWALLSGQTVTTTLEFIVPMETSNADEVIFSLPSFVSSYDPNFAKQCENSANSWKGKFSLLSTPVAPSSTSAVAKNTLRIRGQLSVPWSAPNNASASAAKVKATFNQPSVSYKDLATYGSIRFDFETTSSSSSEETNNNNTNNNLLKGDSFSATLTRPDVVKDATVAIESVTVSHDDRAASSEKVSVALSLAPTISNINPNKLFPNVEVIFLVDCSDDCVSQWGPRVRQALSIAIRGLASDSMFNVVCYGDSVVRSFERSRYAEEQSLDAAENFVNSSVSPCAKGLGRRKLFDAISTVFTEPCVAGYARTVVLLTNGGCDSTSSQQETHRARVVDLVASNSAVATLLNVGLGRTADAALLKSMVQWSAPGSQYRSIPQRYSCSYLEIDEELCGESQQQQQNGSSSSSSENAVASEVVSALAGMLRPSLASVSVRFVSKTDGSVLPEDKIRLASRLPLTIVDGKRVIVFAVASEDVPACTILVTGLIGTEQQSFTTDFTATKSPANSDATSPTSSFNLNFVAALQARLNLLEVYTVRSTLKPEQSAECRRLAGTVRLPSNTTALSTRTEQSAQNWTFNVVHYGWLPLARRCSILPTVNCIGNSTSSPVKVAKKRTTASSLPPLNAKADPFLIVPSSTDGSSQQQPDAFLRDTVDNMITVAAAGDVAQGFVRTQRADGLWDSKSENVWHNLLVRCRSSSANHEQEDELTIDQLRGSSNNNNNGSNSSRRPSSASDLAAARWLAALIVASIESSSSKYDIAVGSMAVKKARAALKNDESLLGKARQAVVGGTKN